MNVVQGQRVNFPLDAAGQLVRLPQTLLRAEDAEVDSWQVTLPPVFVNGVGTSSPVGMPAWRNPPLVAGTLLVEMTWGGGGVSWQTSFPYPVNGASFSVSGDHVILQVTPLDNTTVWNEQTKPSVIGWCKPEANPTAREPLVTWDGTAQGAANPIPAFARALVVTRTDLTADVSVEFSLDGGLTLLILLPATMTMERIPIPLGARTFIPTATVGLVRCAFELAFT